MQENLLCVDEAGKHKYFAVLTTTKSICMGWVRTGNRKFSAHRINLAASATVRNLIAMPRYAAVVPFNQTLFAFWPGKHSPQKMQTQNSMHLGETIFAFWPGKHSPQKMQNQNSMHLGQDILQGNKATLQNWCSWESKPHAQQSHVRGSDR